MGLTLNLRTAVGLAIERLWGIPAPAARFSPDSAIASKAGAAAVARPALPAWVVRLGSQARSAAAAILHGMQVSRMRQAQREIAAYRSRLPRSEGSIG